MGKACFLISYIIRRSLFHFIIIQQHQAVHGGGPHSFHICEASYKKDPTQSCLDANPLRFEATGLTEQIINPDEVVNGPVPPMQRSGKLFNYRVT